MRHLFVVNPHSFAAQAEMESVIEGMKSCFDGGEDVRFHLSRYPRDGLAVVYRYLQGTPRGETARVYAVGGDGILFDCLNGMVSFPNAELTCVPYGSANDFIRAFGEDTRRAFRDIRRLKEGPSRPVDVLHSGTNYALNQANIGLIAQTIITANKHLRGAHAKWFRGQVSNLYVLSALRALLEPGVIGQRYSVLADGKDLSGRYSNIHISNGPCNGGNMLPNPYAITNDGALDVIFAATDSRLKIASVINDYTFGKFEKHADVFRHVRCRSIEIHSEMPLHVELDGEGFYAQVIKFELIPGKIRFFTPEGMDWADYSGRGYRAGRAGGHV